MIAYAQDAGNPSLDIRSGRRKFDENQSIAQRGELMRVLVIEDEQKALAFIKTGLEEAGYSVDTAADGAEGLILACEENYDVIVLDVMLPTMDGWTVLKNLRTLKTTPVLFLTARDDGSDRVRGLELGGDDYLAKPFAFVEFLARVRTLSRRGPPRESDVIIVADLEIDVTRRKVRRGGKRIELTPREFALLQLLARKKGEVMSRTQIASYVWDMNFDSDTNVVEVAIRRLRAKIDEDFDLKLIGTMRGVGYVIDSREES